MKVFFDASVIVAALLSPTGGSSLVLEFVNQHRIVGITSETVIKEIVNLDKLSKFKKSEEEINGFIAKSGLVVRESVTLAEIEPY